MGSEVRAEQPADGDERSILVGWLALHRDALAAKCRGLSDEQLVQRAAEPSALSLLGLVRHMAEMERVYGVWITLHELRAEADVPSGHRANGDCALGRMLFGCI